MFLERAAIILRNQLIKSYPLFQGCEPCAYRPARLADRSGPRSEYPFPVDIVYTWVDGADQKLAAKRAAYLPPEEQRQTVRHGVALFRDNQELRYSLRSVELYAPWVRRIFILTDAQIPDWLDTDHEKVRVVDHRDCIPSMFLPTFNSRVMEAHLHRIPDLSEHYIYFNDDFFLAAPCMPSDFFTANGIPYLFTDWKENRRRGYARADTPHACSYHNTRSYLEAQGTSPAPDAICAHVPYAQTKKNAREAYAFYEKAIRSFSANKFRSTDDLAFHCHALFLWSYANKCGVPCDMPYYYINTRRFDRQTCYSVLLREKGSETAPLFFCLNDVGNDQFSLSQQNDLAEFFASFFPAAASFERRR